MARYAASTQYIKSTCRVTFITSLPPKLDRVEYRRSYQIAIPSWLHKLFIVFISSTVDWHRSILLLCALWAFLAYRSAVMFSWRQIMAEIHLLIQYCGEIQDMERYWRTETHKAARSMHYLTVYVHRRFLCCLVHISALQRLYENVAFPCKACYYVTAAECDEFPCELS